MEGDHGERDDAVCQAGCDGIEEVAIPSKRQPYAWRVFFEQMKRREGQNNVPEGARMKYQNLHYWIIMVFRLLALAIRFDDLIRRELHHTGSLYPLRKCRHVLREGGTLRLTDTHPGAGDEGYQELLTILLRAGDQLYDGEVLRIAPNEVTFRQNLNDPQSVKPFRDITRQLNATIRP